MPPSTTAPTTKTIIAPSQNQHTGCCFSKKKRKESSLNLQPEFNSKLQLPRSFFPTTAHFYHRDRVDMQAERIKAPPPSPTH
mmetsp:Transcript_44435/g.69508  ORF Transcript_44435/g.69508 Transcript_44435/m.69508 type:complete len:82 (-) Transcript_44435:70-315(-)